MTHRIEVISKQGDARAEIRRRKIKAMGLNVQNVQLVDVYTLEPDLNDAQLGHVVSMLHNPVSQTAKPEAIIPENFDYVVEIGFLPGVTDNVGNTVREGMEDGLKMKLEGQAAYSSQKMFLSGVSREQAIQIAEGFSNPVIQRNVVKSREEILKERNVFTIPRVRLDKQPSADIVNILSADDLELQRIGKMGVYDHDRELSREEFENLRSSISDNKLRSGDLIERDGRFFVKSRRGPLAMDLPYMKANQDYFRARGKNPTDVELEVIAQTWSEHCKHTIFADPIDEFQEGLFKTFIKGATERIRKEKGDKDFCVSVFTDNSGGIIFDENNLASHKIETHNSPSALDPFGGAITGIVGVNRDPMGFGLGAKPIINIYGYCFGYPEDARVLYKGENFTQKMLSTRRIMDGVIEGVNVGGNCSGIPTPQGFLIFDEHYRGKPLVFVGTVGFIPKESAGRKSHEKKANPGDYIVMVGGRVGKDGIHGATFSSEALDTGSPAGAVQIGDPITQKKMSDALVKEARDLGLYTSITDNGAGGLSCSVNEMAKESGGCHVYLDRAPVKYPGLKPWEIDVSESQERMTLSVPKGKWGQFSDLMNRRGVEATIIGEFTDSGKSIAEYNGKVVVDLDMDFLHDGLPQRPIKTTFTRKVHEEPKFDCLDNLTEDLHNMLARKNLASFEFISKQYDHEVQGGSVLKPLQGKGRVNGDATITRPLLDSKKAVILSQGINPTYSEIDTYDMAACAIDSAVRNAVAAGASLEHLALLDNFCWCSSNEPERLGQLKRAVQACYDFAVAYQTPFISGKDSMFNDFKGFDENGQPIKISIHPTLLVSTIGVMEDAGKAVSLDAKFAGDRVYVLGETREELGASEYFAMKGEQQRGEKFIGNSVPRVDAEKNLKLYQRLQKSIERGLVASAQSVGRGGLALALAKTAMGGKLGMELDIGYLPGKFSRDDYALFSESQGRVVVTVSPQISEEFERVMAGNAFSEIGIVTNNDDFVIYNHNKKVVATKTSKLIEAYKSTFKEY